MADFTLPELGENIAAGDVLRVLVNAGDTLTKDQPVLELETDKATIEVPSSVAGKITEVKVKAGDKVKVGQSILIVEDALRPAQGAPSDESRGGAATAAAPAPAAKAAAEAKPEPEKAQPAAAAVAPAPAPVESP